MNGRRREIALLGGRFRDDMDPNTKTNGVTRAAHCRAGLQPADRPRVWADPTRAWHARDRARSALGNFGRRRRALSTHAIVRVRTDFS